MLNQKAWKEYFQNMTGIVEKIGEEQEENILQGAKAIAESIEKDGIIHAFGVGHSHLVTEEVFWRAGTLANIHAILEPSMTGHTEITKSGDMEKLEGAGEILVDYHKLESKDVLIVISNSGNNAAPIDVARVARERGVKVIAITSIEYSDYLKPLHSTGKKLKDHADIVIDNCCPIGDAALKFEELEAGVGPTSTIAAAYIINALMVQAVENLLKRGQVPDVYFNGSLAANSEAIKEHNQRLIDKYYRRIRNL